MASSSLSHTNDSSKIGSSEIHLLKREFVNIDTRLQSRNGFEICIMQWNILAQALTDEKCRCPKDALLWEHRKLALLEEIRQTNPDVLCLQEVDKFDYFHDSLKLLGYNGMFFPKPDSPTLCMYNNSGPDGCALFAKSSVFEIVSSKNVIIEVDCEPTNQVAIVCQLQHLNSPWKLCVVCTHLKAKVGFEERRAKQGAFLLEYLKETWADLPLVICGDFNATPDEPVVKLFSSTELQLSSAYSLPNGSTPDANTHYVAPYTTAKWSKTGNGEKKFVRIIDYIWYTKAHFAVTQVRSVPTINDLGENLVPSFSYPSDHLSLAAKLVFTK